MGVTRDIYKRLSIEKLKPEFTGWDHYIKLLEQVGYGPDQAFFATMFELGCRIREVLGIRDKTGGWISPPLKRSNFLFTKPDRIIVVDIPILKRYEKIDHRFIRKDFIPENEYPSHRKLWHRTEEGRYERKVWVTERRFHTRRVELLLDEPLMDYVLPYIKSASGILFDKSYDYYYQICRRLDPLREDYPKVPEHIFPHWWRSQRACQLAAEYGLTLHRLLEFFDWKDVSTAQMYAKLSGELADKMSLVDTVWRKNRKAFIEKARMSAHVTKPQIEYQPKTKPKIDEKKKLKKKKQMKKTEIEKLEKKDVNIFELLSKGD